MNNIKSLSTPLTHSGILHQSNVHIENILESLGPDLTRTIIDDVMGKNGLFKYIPLTLNEEIAYTTVTNIYHEVVKNKVDVEWQENNNYYINYYKGDKNG